MKISDLIPDFYKNNLEMDNIIYTEEKELEEGLKKGIEDRFTDTFITKATEKGIDHFENILNIKANPEVEELEFRRSRVLNRLMSSTPYTERYMINRLNAILGEGNWNYVIDYNAYTLTINSLVPGRLWYREIIDFITKIIPMNIDWTINIYQASWNSVKDSFSTFNEFTTMTWQDVLNGEYIV